MLPVFKSDDTTLMLMQNKWASELNPVLNSPLSQGNILKDITLAVGTNVINHKLGKKMQGWYVIDKNANANIYRSAPLNNLTLTLTSDAIVTIALAVL